MEFRRTNRSDLDEILNIYSSAWQFILENGNPDQCRGGYPGEKIILSDIEKNQHFVCSDDGQTKACFAYIEGDDPMYLDSDCREERAQI
jgi:hypothetical protein